MPSGRVCILPRGSSDVLLAGDAATTDPVRSLRSE